MALKSGQGIIGWIQDASSESGITAKEVHGAFLSWGRRRAALALGAAEKVQCPVNAARERSRVRTLHQAFLALQAALPTVPPDTKLSKLDVLLLATSYIAHLSRTLEQGLPGPRIAPTVFLHPLKKWPMRSCLYASSWTGGIPTPTPFAVFSGWPQPRLEARGATL
ncbi:transcription factor 23 isoform X2 [Sphaerodactylus townsendi]|uniref:transcription factor 23 isoform X2 n=1 Tax=Sphaerodactylus townsendi TaxID=933632 RepID=UPI002025B661|nr:transcription factor 23 isoform X2 [Sphaerodactylus townsendi]XP_048371936.1 transcription factor 23 isoform X2 [Sphaerodactylus townsendi]XP_048371946.1 transcription factor 23 isoform X2 [Sphaerodactylus townsendi]